MDRLLGAFGITALVGLIAAAVVGAVINELNKRYIQSQRPVVLWSILGTLAAASLLLTMLENPIRDIWLRASGKLAFERSHDRGPPIVIGIYPKEAFGPLHKDGLNWAISQHHPLQVVNLVGGLDDMKTGKADEVLRQLRLNITTKNVVAVVGPPVSEFTGPVIRTVWQTGRYPPVFITSAAPREPVGWRSAGIPLFRINSGIDERADEFVAFARASLARGIPLSFLVEQPENSSKKLYGQLVFDEIRARLPQWDEWNSQGRISIIPYTRGDVTEDRVRAQLDVITQKPRIIMLLGTGGDYMAVANAFYRADAQPRAAMLGGWMNAFDTEAKFRKNQYQWRRLFEITDVDIDPNRPRSRYDVDFTGLFGGLSPSVRDQAFSFDAGKIVAQVFRAVQADHGPDRNGLRVDRHFLKDMVERIRQFETVGVTGPIRFDHELGQNMGGHGSARRQMTYTIFNGSRWVRLNGPGDVAALALAPPPTAPAASAAPGGR